MNYLLKTISTFLLILLLNTIGVSQVPTSQKLDSNMAIKKVDASGIAWFDPRDEPFDLIGFEWIKKDTVYRRLPVNPDWEIREEVNQLANHTAGGQIRFKTNSKRILLKVKLNETSNMYHMPATGQSGFDLYVLNNNTQRYIGTTRFSHDTIQYQAEVFHSIESRMHSFSLNFPLYNGVNSVLIGLDEESEIEKPQAFSRKGKFVIYGTSITQGGCVARPGMAYSNILSRKLGAQFVNLGFSGNGKGEPELAHLINQINNVSFIILDYEANAPVTIVNTLEPFIDILRKQHPKTPVLIMSKIRFARDFTNSPAYLLTIKNRDFQKNLVKKRKKEGDKNIYFLDGSKILGNDYDECTVDGVHPSDLGSKRIADALLVEIVKILKD